MKASARPRADATMTLADGRALAYCEWGDPTGSAVLLLHGGPGSRLLCPDEDATAAAGVWLLTVDRPGYGGSDPRPDPTLLGWAEDVRALVDRLGLDRFAVVGFSAAGGYALACAARMPGRVSVVALSLPWGFALAGVTAPVVVWHGELDHLVAPAHATYLSSVLPGATLELYPEDGHLLLLLRHWGEMLAAVTA